MAIAQMLMWVVMAIPVAIDHMPRRVMRVIVRMGIDCQALGDGRAEQGEIFRMATDRFGGAWQNQCALLAASGQHRRTRNKGMHRD